jgi:hypothetical protein
VKFTLEQAKKAQSGEYRYNSTRYLTLALERVGVQHHHPLPGRFTPGKDSVPIVYEAGLAPRPFWTGVENLAPPEFDPRNVQPVPTALSRLTLHSIRICKKYYSVEPQEVIPDN